MTTLIAPHGGKLIDRIARGAERARLLELTRDLPRVTLNERELSDLELIATGAFSPLTGFLTEVQYHSVVNDLRLPDGTVWALPITLAVDADTGETWRQDIATLRRVGWTENRSAAGWQLYARKAHWNKTADELAKHLVRQAVLLWE